MSPFDDSGMDDSYLRPCACGEQNEINKTFCYVEGTRLDVSRSDTKEELGENVWFQAKPPRLFIKDGIPLVSARQLQITRIIMGGPQAIGVVEVEKPKKEKGPVSMKKKKSTVKFLSTTDITLEIDR